MRWGVTLAALGAVAVSSPASAQSRDVVDIGLTAGLIAVGLIPPLLFDADEDQRWDHEVFDFDERVRGRYSRGARRVSDATLIATVAAPVIGLAGRQCFDREFGRSMLLYGETLAASFALTTITKLLVQRPRPFAYSTHPTVQGYAAEAGDDLVYSFFSGHSSMAFAAAVSGSYLFASSVTGSSAGSRAARGAGWGLQLTLASFTAGLRVRGGAHYPTDVATGALVGVTVGLAVPLLHPDRRGHRPGPEEWAGISAGLVAGSLLAAFVPFDSEVGTSGPAMTLAPFPTAGGAGLALGGAF